jgi:hypothetical protein
MRLNVRSRVRMYYLSGNPNIRVTVDPRIFGYRANPKRAPKIIHYWLGVSVAGRLVRSTGWRSRLCLRPPPEGRTHVHMYYGRASMRTYGEFLVLTP